MTDPRSAVRSILIYVICLPLALVLGWQLTGLTSWQRDSILTVGIVLGVLLFPILLRWHHPLLVLSWNTIVVIPAILPGRPQVRLCLTAASFLISYLMYALDRRHKPLSVPLVARPLLAFALVVVVTMLLRGGAGFGALGSSVGGAGRYVIVLGAIAGFFALSARQIPLEKANLYIGLYLLGGLTLAISSLMPYTPHFLQFIFMFFPVERLTGNEGFSFAQGQTRPYGVAVACMACLLYLLARWGVRGIFQTSKPWRIALFLLLWAGIMLGGYRSFILLGLGILVVQFYLEGLFTMRVLPGLLVIVTLFVAALPLVNRLPYQMQRSLAFLPVSVTQEVAVDTRASTQWRLEIWKRTIAEVPQYLLLGKGYALDINDILHAMDRDRMGNREVGESAQLAGDYHNGPLSIIIPFGAFGMAAMIWFWVASWRLLLHNCRYGHPELKVINTFLLAMFVTRVAQFIVIFGALATDLAYFVGIVGMSVALNGGLARAQQTVPEVEPTPPPQRVRGLRSPLPPPAPFRT